MNNKSFPIYGGLGAVHRIMSSLRAVVSASVFPENCVLCGTATFGIPLCRSCSNSLLAEASASCDAAHCSICGKPLLSEDFVCMQCRTEKAPAKELDGIRSVFPYLLRKKYLLYEWKIAGHKSLTPFFAECLEKLYTHSFSGLPVVPVPPRPGKIRKNGWDQTDSLASVFKQKYCISVLKYLERTSGMQQKKLGRSERLSRSGQYKASKLLMRLSRDSGHKNLPSHVVLLDDVMTTGSTLCSCSAVLKSFGIEKVSALTLFTVPA